MFGSITRSISGIAKKSLGSVTKVRSLMAFNPLASGLLLPPQVSLGLKVAGIAGNAFGLKIPNEQELIGLASGEVDKIFGGIRSKVGATLDDIENTIGKVDSTIAGISNNETINKLNELTAEEVLNDINWLL